MPTYGQHSKLFDVQAADYAAYRPDYPKELYTRLLEFAGAAQREAAVDIATGVRTRLLGWIAALKGLSLMASPVRLQAADRQLQSSAQYTKGEGMNTCIYRAKLVAVLRASGRIYVEPLNHMRALVWIQRLCCAYVTVILTFSAYLLSSVIGLDPSTKQLEQAMQAKGVEYRQGSAEDTGLPDSSFDLVAVAQALHW